MNLGGSPKVVVTPSPPQADTTKELIKREETRKKSLQKAIAMQSQLGANQLRGSGTGLNLGNPYA